MCRTLICDNPQRPGRFHCEEKGWQAVGGLLVDAVVLATQLRGTPDQLLRAWGGAVDKVLASQAQEPVFRSPELMESQL